MPVTECPNCGRDLTAIERLFLTCSETDGCGETLEERDADA